MNQQTNQPLPNKGGLEAITTEQFPANVRTLYPNAQSSPLGTERPDRYADASIQALEAAIAATNSQPKAVADQAELFKRKDWWNQTNEPNHGKRLEIGSSRVTPDDEALIAKLFGGAAAEFNEGPSLGSKSNVKPLHDSPAKNPAETAAARARLDQIYGENRHAA